MPAREATDKIARADRATLFVRVEEHGDLREIGVAACFEDFHYMQEYSDTAFVVCNAGGDGLIAFDLERAGGGCACRVDRVHMRDQQEFFLARAFEADSEIGADDTVGGCDAFGYAASS